MRCKVFTIACVLAAGLAAGEAGVLDRGADASARPLWIETEWPRIGFCNCSIGVAFELLVGRAEVSVGLQ